MQWNKQNLAWAEWAGPQVELLCNLVGWDSPPTAPDSSLSSSSLSTTASSYLSYWSLLLRKPLVNIIVMHWSLGLVVIIPFVMFTSLDPLMLSILNPILFDTESNTIQKMETEKFWNWNVTLCITFVMLPSPDPLSNGKWLRRGRGSCSPKKLSCWSQKLSRWS